MAHADGATKHLAEDMEQGIPHKAVLTAISDLAAISRDSARQLTNRFGYSDLNDINPMYYRQIIQDCYREIAAYKQRKV